MRNVLAFRGLSYLIGVRFLGFDRGLERRRGEGLLFRSATGDVTDPRTNGDECRINRSIWSSVAPLPSTPPASLITLFRPVWRNIGDQNHTKGENDTEDSQAN